MKKCKMLYYGILFLNGFDLSFKRGKQESKPGEELIKRQKYDKK